MKRSIQGLCIGLGSVVATVVVIAAAVAWGPHHCDLVFSKIIECAIGNYESLSGGMVAATAAIFAGWLAWSGVQVQIAAEERRAAAESKEVEQVLQDDLNHFAEGLGALWKILERYDPNEGAEINDAKIEGISRENRSAHQDRFPRQRQTNRFQENKRKHDPSAVLVDQLLHDGTAIRGMTEAPRPKSSTCLSDRRAKVKPRGEMIRCFVADARLPDSENRIGRKSCRLESCHRYLPS
jgi:hypothetical protein